MSNNEKINGYNKDSLDTICATLAYAMGIDAPKFAADKIDGECGSHGLDMPEDLNVVHLYKGFKKEI